MKLIKSPKHIENQSYIRKIWIGKPRNINNIELVVKTIPSMPIPTPQKQINPGQNGFKGKVYKLFKLYTNAQIIQFAPKYIQSDKSSSFILWGKYDFDAKTS